MKHTVSIATVVAGNAFAGGVIAQSSKAPRTWDEAALRDWATPVAGLNQRPGHFSQAEYERAPIDNLRSYPVYYPGREPAGYWEMLQTVGPKPLIEPATLTTEADWIRAGKRVSRNTTSRRFVSRIRRRSPPREIRQRSHDRR